jgi:hypothetical protein
MTSNRINITFNFTYTFQRFPSVKQYMQKETYTWYVIRLNLWPINVIMCVRNSVRWQHTAHTNEQQYNTCRLDVSRSVTVEAPRRHRSNYVDSQFLLVIPHYCILYILSQAETNSLLWGVSFRFWARYIYCSEYPHPPGFPLTFAPLGGLNERGTLFCDRHVWLFVSYWRPHHCCWMTFQFYIAPLKTDTELFKDPVRTAL